MRIALLGLVLLCGACKAKAGEHCSGGSDCAEGLRCYMVDINFTCLTDAQADALCKKSIGCKDNRKCGAKAEPKYNNGHCE
jgi:hypothetical protein